MEVTPMSKTVTLRLSNEEYEQILNFANRDHRPISNFITHVVLNRIDDAFYADPIEMAQIKSDEKLMKSLKAGHKAAKEMKGRFVE